MEGQQTEPLRGVASVLVIAADQSIESLMGQLVAYAGHRPVFDPTLGAAGETIRRVRPDVALLDVSLPPQIVEACLAASHEVGTRPVLTSSMASLAELSAEAEARNALHFELPGGPKPLSDVINRALSERRAPARVSVRLPRGDAGMYRAVCAALAGIARGRLLARRCERMREASASLQLTLDEALRQTRHGRAALKAAVADYARQLKSHPVDQVIQQIRETLRECARIVGAEDTLDPLLHESEEWTREAVA